MRPDRKTLSLFALLAVLGGLNPVAVLFSNDELDPFWGSGARFVAATLVMAVIAVVRRVPMPRGRELAGALLFGVLGLAGGYAFYYWGVQFTTAGTAQVLMALVPLMTLLLAVLHRQERLTLRAAGGALISLAGIAVVFADQLGSAVPAVALVALLLSALTAAEAGVLLKWFPEGDPIGINLVGMAICAAILLALSVVTGESWTLPSSLGTWLGVTYLVLVGSVVVFLLYVTVVQRWTASGASYSFLIFPLVTTVAAALLGRERLTVAFLAGGAIVLAGVYVGAIAGARRRAEASAGAVDGALEEAAPG